jgi:molybdopterin molybdotransferase
MLTVDEALAIILNHVGPGKPVATPLSSALWRVLAQDIISPDNIPFFNNSAMDGFAVLSSDTTGASKECPVSLTVVEDVPAGAVPCAALTSGKASRIMTGAIIPEGADVVVKVEDVTFDGKRVIINDPAEAGLNVRFAGEDVKRGDRVLARGVKLRPPEIGLLAALGITDAPVFPAPGAAIISTGSELVEPGVALKSGQIRNSNSYAIAAQVLSADAVPLPLGIAGDDESITKKKLAQGLESADAVITSAGVSMGEYDLVKKTLEKMGAAIMFWQVAMRPGKPLCFAVLRGKPIFCLPGNPVSAMVSFEVFVRPALMKMSGHETYSAPLIDAIAEEPFPKKRGLRYFLRGRLLGKEGDRRVTTTGPQGSGVLSSMVKDDCLVLLPENIEEVRKGDAVKVLPLGYGRGFLLKG